MKPGLTCSRRMGRGKYGEGKKQGHDPMHTALSDKQGGGIYAMAWACMAVSWNRSLVFTDDVTADRSSRKNGDAFGALLSARIQPNATALIGDCKWTMTQSKLHKQPNKMACSFYGESLSTVLLTQPQKCLRCCCKTLRWCTFNRGSGKSRNGKAWRGWGVPPPNWGIVGRSRVQVFPFNSSLIYIMSCRSLQHAPNLESSLHLQIDDSIRANSFHRVQLQIPLEISGIQPGNW